MLSSKNFATPSPREAKEGEVLPSYFDSNQKSKQFLTIIPQSDSESRFGGDFSHRAIKHAATTAVKKQPDQKQSIKNHDFKKMPSTIER